jgi:hypothetical protein
LSGTDGNNHKREREKETKTENKARETKEDEKRKVSAKRDAETMDNKRKPRKLYQ